MKVLSLLFNQVTYEGWHRMWESGPKGLPEKEDADRGLFQHQMSFEDKFGIIRKRKVVVGGGVPSADSFFHSRVFPWRPASVWGYSLHCPRSECPACAKEDTFLYCCGYSKAVRQICHMSGWYSMLMEVLACSTCRKAAQDSKEHAINSFLAWDAAIISQLSPAHRAMFPAVLTLRWVSQEEGQLVLSEAMRQRVISGWNKLDFHNRSIQHFDSLYSACWGNVLFRCTKGDLVNSSLVQSLRSVSITQPPACWTPGKTTWCTH